MQSSEGEISSHLGHPSAEDVLSRKAYRFVVVFAVVQNVKTNFWEKGMNQRKSKRRSVVIATDCMKGRKYKTLTRRDWAMARQKNTPNPASYHITMRDWIQSRLQ